jgi:thiamine kinase-like enzyme
MPPDDPERVAARHVPGVGKPEIHRLGNGLVNETYRVLRDGSTHAMRLAVLNRDDLGRDRAWEARVLERAAAADLAAPLEYCDPQRGILIVRWVEGRSWTQEDTRWPSNISRMAEFMRRIHALPMPASPRSMSPAEWIEHYSAEARLSARRNPAVADSGTTAPGGASAIADVASSLQAAATKRLAALAALPSIDPVLCHSDLHTLNLIDRGSSLILLDWEYAHASDPFWDLAGWGANNDFDVPLLHDLLASYARRRPTGDEILRLQLMSWLYDYVCLWWSEVYSSMHRSARPGTAVQGDAADGVSARALQLAARLHASK